MILSLISGAVGLTRPLQGGCAPAVGCRGGGLALVTALSSLAVALGIRRWGPSLWRSPGDQGSDSAPVDDGSGRAE